jgi:outer membrane immunogenic protein
MKFGKLILAAALTVCASGAATAQDSWKGFYVGFNTGLAFAHSNVATNVSDNGTGYLLPSEVDAINFNGRRHVSPFGLTGGLTLGYNLQFGHMVFGVEGDYDGYNQDNSRSVTFADPCGSGCTYTLFQRVEVNHMASLRARAGWAHAHWLLYGTFGLAHAQINYNELFTDTFANAREESWQSHSKRGLAWGAGFEVQFAQHWSVKTEWIHSRFGATSGPGGLLSAYTPAQYFPGSVFTHSFDLSANTIRAGVNFRF